MKMQLELITDEKRMIFKHPKLMAKVSWVQKHVITMKTNLILNLNHQQ